MIGMWNWFQQGQIDRVSQNLAATAADASFARSDVQELERRVETLALLCRALVEELDQKVGLSEAELRAKMLEIDLRDGVEDGKYNPNSQAKCGGCGRKVMKRRGGCIYCGEKFESRAVL